MRDERSVCQECGCDIDHCICDEVDEIFGVAPFTPTKKPTLKKMEDE